MEGGALSRLAEHCRAHPGLTTAGIMGAFARSPDFAIFSNVLAWSENQDDYSAKREQPVDHFLLSREWIAVRMVALERGGGRCACCGRTAHDGIIINVDHIKNRLKHPELALTVDNLQLLCNECNRGKGNKFSTDWRRKPAPSNVDA